MLNLCRYEHPSGDGRTVEPDDFDALEQAYRYGLQLLDDLEAKRSTVAKRCWAI